MVLLLRRGARTVSAVLVLLSLWSLPHRSQPDICVPPGLEAHDESKHVFTAADPAAHEEHCALCHWMRSLKPAFTARPVEHQGADGSAAVFVLHRDGRSSTARGQLPSRAPPLL